MDTGVSLIANTLKNKSINELHCPHQQGVHNFHWVEVGYHRLKLK